MPWECLLLLAATRAVGAVARRGLRTIRFASVLFCCTVLLVSQVRGDALLASGDHARTLQHDGRGRSYIVHVPSNYDCRRPTPVLLAFHAAETNAAMLASACGLNDKADCAGFIAVYPDGTGKRRRLTWNAGNCCGYASRQKVDDVGFVRAVLDDLAGIANVDSRRVFATGISNGAMLCYRLAAELSDRIAAIAPVSGAMATETFRPRRPVSVMHFHGTEDTILPFGGGIGPRFLATGVLPSVEHSIRVWAAADGCPADPVVVNLPCAADDGTTVERRTYGPGKDGAEVVLFVINGGGHTWPGQEPRVRFLGVSTRNISANDLMWEFFQRHPMPASSPASPGKRQ
jgi:polyhydroxybutyrate depolymerase